jgi:tetratricopeptide (TPR) repeat protein
MTLMLRRLLLARIPSRLLLIFGLLLVATGTTQAQDTDVKKYTVDVQLDPAAHAATVRSTLAIWNPTSAPKRTLQFRIGVKAEVRSVTVGGQTAQFDVLDDKRNTDLKVVRVTFPTAIAGSATADLVVESRFVADGTPEGGTIGIGETVLLPSSHWVPFVNTEYVQYGANTSPFTITIGAISGEKALSGGTLAGSTFAQPLYGLPFLIAGEFDAPVTASASGVTLEAWIPAGAPASLRSGAERILAEAGKVLAYYSQQLGAPPATTFRVIASDRGAGFASPSGVVFGQRVFARDTTDAETFELLADGLARIWTDGGAAIRGAVPGASADQPKGVALVRDALPRFLAVLAMGNRYGADAERQAFERARIGLSQMGAIGLADPLSVLNPSRSSYRGVVVTRGLLTLRIIEREVGREKFLGSLRDTLAAARTSGALTAAALRATIAKASGNTSIESIYAAWLDQAVAPDLIVGIPQRDGAVWASALRNLGTGDIPVDVVATTASGKKLTSRTTVPSEGFGRVQFDTQEAITAVEVDPDHVIFETDYANNARPPHPPAVQAFNDGIGMVVRKDYAQAEAKLRLVLAENATDAVTRAWLARALLGQGKSADAEKEATAALGAEPVPTFALGWAHIVLGQIAQAAGRNADAMAHFRRAAVEAADTPALIAARQGLVETERTANQAPPVDESIRKFFASFDAALSAGVNTVQAEQFIDSGTLPGFIRGLVTSVARKWSTEVLRAEALDRDEVLIDARFTVTQGAESSASPALVRLRRVTDGWRIVDVQLLGGQ